MDTIGNIVDKLTTTGQKMWMAQEDIYKIRRMSEQEFVEFAQNPCNLVFIYQWLKKACDLNVQRNQLMNELDATLIRMIKDAVSGKEIDNGAYLQNAHKTY